MTNVIVSRRPTVTVKTNGTTIQSDDVTVKSVSSIGIDNMSEMNDVDVSGASNGDILAYDTSTQKWSPQSPLSLGGTIDGGSF